MKPVQPQVLARSLGSVFNKAAVTCFWLLQHVLRTELQFPSSFSNSLSLLLASPSARSTILSPSGLSPIPSAYKLNFISLGAALCGPHTTKKSPADPEVSSGTTPFPLALQHHTYHAFTSLFLSSLQNDRRMRTTVSPEPTS